MEVEVFVFDKDVDELFYVLDGVDAGEFHGFELDY